MLYNYIFVELSTKSYQIIICFKGISQRVNILFSWKHKICWKIKYFQNLHIYQIYYINSKIQNNNSEITTGKCMKLCTIVLFELRTIMYETAMYDEAKNCSMRVYNLYMYKDVPIWCFTKTVFQTIRPFSSSLLNSMYGECQWYAYTFNFGL